MSCPGMQMLIEGFDPPNNFCCWNRSKNWFTIVVYSVRWLSTKNSENWKKDRREFLARGINFFCLFKLIILLWNWEIPKKPPICYI